MTPQKYIKRRVKSSHLVNYVDEAFKLINEHGLKVTDIHIESNWVCAWVDKTPEEIAKDEEYQKEVDMRVEAEEKRKLAYLLEKYGIPK